MSYLELATAGTGVARDAHYVIPTGGTLPIRTLLLEPQRTNLSVHSEEFNDAAWGKNGVTVTANAITAPDGTLTADLLTSAGSGTFELVSMPCTFTGDGEKSVSCFFKAGNAALTEIELRDATTGIAKHRIRLTWTAGVPALSSVTGTGTVYPIEALANGWYRALFSATSVVAANNNQIRIYPTGTAQVAGTVYAWGAQAENAVVPSSYIPTAATTVTRNADNLYFPFTAPPQALTVYVRGVERGFQYSSATPRYAQISNAANSAPRFLLYSLGTSPAALHGNGIDADAIATVTISRVLGDVTEARGVLRVNGSCVVGASINGATEVVSAASTTPAAGLAVAWSDTRLYINGPQNTDQPHAYTHVVVAQGEQTMGTMRQLAGVA